MAYKFIDKKYILLTYKFASSGACKSKITSNQKLAKELHKYNKGFVFQDASLIFLVNMHCLFLCNAKMFLQLLMLFKTF